MQLFLPFKAIFLIEEQWKAAIETLFKLNLHVETSIFMALNSLGDKVPNEEKTEFDGFNVAVQCINNRTLLLGIAVTLL